ncbi:MAG: hypothetical protein O2901_04970 [Verrucomicrobia bacterium]|nr:hypothetical protein [Verrucomicrobiota bacterium]
MRAALAVYAAILAAAMSSGCVSTGPVTDVASREAASKAWEAGRRAAEADCAEERALYAKERALYAKERALVPKRIDAALQQGRVQGDAAAVKRIEAEQLAAEKAAAARDAAALTAFMSTLAETPVLGDRKLRTDKGRTLEARHLVDMIQTQLEKLECELVLSVPLQAMPRVQDYGEQKILLTMSSEFNESFFENIEKLSILDALNLLNKLYGFSAWISGDKTTICLGFAVHPPSSHPNTKIDLYFSEREFRERVR